MALNWRGAAQGIGNAISDFGKQQMEDIYRNEFADAQAARERSLSLNKLKDTHSLLSSPEYLAQEDIINKNEVQSKVKAQVSAMKSSEGQQLRKMTAETKLEEAKASATGTLQAERDAQDWKLAFQKQLGEQENSQALDLYKKKAEYDLSNLPEKLKQATAITLAEEKAKLDFAIQNAGREKEAELNASINNLTNLAKEVNPDLKQDQINNIKRAATINVIKDLSGANVKPETSLKISTLVDTQVNQLSDDDPLILGFINSNPSIDSLPEGTRMQAARDGLKDSLYSKEIERVQKDNGGREIVNSILGNKSSNDNSKIIAPEVINRLNSISTNAERQVAIDELVKRGKDRTTIEKSLLPIVEKPATNNIEDEEDIGPWSALFGYAKKKGVGKKAKDFVTTTRKLGSYMMNNE